ncbi:Gfo/Idh/MocA family protein [Anaeropeptidivorans aminofermentans]|uniref:Gfo/Idh/MocA family protein n=1 Tax=Anaeropeptidivorans aminofermentans TaxID=2934315 RepID=UPI00202446D3|nr:Gfo/Idh/MocA family oxidoreductase [Anaeropeptidivorans aminofermentans]
MKLGILGSGAIVHTFLSQISKTNEIELCAICGRKKSKDTLEKLSLQYHIKKIYYDYDEMLKDDEITEIYVALPNSLHYENSLLALNAEKNVICEKPFTSNMKELLHLIDIAKKKSLFLFEAIIPMYLENYFSIKEDLNRIGRVKILQLDFSQYSSRYNNFKQGETPIAFDPLYSGGALMDLNIYNIHFTVGLFGLPEEIKYYPNMERGIDTSGILILSYKDFKASLVASKDCASQSSGKILGTEGAITVNSPTSMCKSYTLNIYNEYTDTKNHNLYPEIMIPEFKAFDKCIKERDFSFCHKMLDHSINVMKVCQKAREEAGIIFPADKVKEI